MPGTSPPGIRLSPQLSLARCPHCMVANPNIHGIHQVQLQAHGNSPRALHWTIYACASCAGIVAGASIQPPQQVVIHRPGVPGPTNDCVWLIPEIDVLDATITGKLRSFLEQARETFHAPAGSIMLSASAVDEVLKLNGFTQGSLYNRIDDAAQKGAITNEMGRWAHQVRLDANDQRHADASASLPTETDALRAYDFAKTLVDLLVVLPARVTRGVQTSAPKSGP